MLTPAAILPMLRDVVKVHVLAKFGPAAAAAHRQLEVNGEVRRCLELISVSRVFDVEGLWEVITEIETPPSPTSEPSVAAGEEVKGGEIEDLAEDVSAKDQESTLIRSGSPRLTSQRPVREDEGKAVRKTLVLPSLRSPPKIERTEIGDSEEEDEGLSLSPSSPLAQQSSASPPQPSPNPNPPIPLIPSPSPPPADVNSEPNNISPSTNKQEEFSHVPDIIVITHFSTLLANLFTRSADNKTSAHTTLQLLSSHLRYLSRSAAGPLIMLLNTTSASSSSYSSTTTSTSAMNATTSRGAEAAHKTKSLEPTLRSIFHPGPGGTGKGGEGDTRRHPTIKPAFGVTFAQFLDLHLLCTRVPRTRSDAENLYAPGNNTSSGAGEVKYSWVVEVLLDELGAWEWDDGDGGDEKGKNDVGWTRRNREQRWGAVDVRSGVRLVDAVFQEMRPQGPVRLAAGFGGPPPRGL
ncbi:hypothetical protein F4805DRAFT_428974 [Annulohypoxylon moriforme]|nr:hypothetical protein F4805DRAFT_428974 [Annulohypoxylon moriforme]